MASRAHSQDGAHAGFDDVHLPFEAPLFQEAGLRTEFVGHPLVDEIASIRKEGVRDPSLVGLFPAAGTVKLTGISRYL